MYPAQFADRAGISSSIIYEAEEGTRNVGLKVLLRIQAAFGTSLNWLILGVGPMLIKDTIMPYRADALEIFAANYPVVEAPGIQDLLLDRALVDQLQLTGEEVLHLLPLIKGETGWALRTMDRQFWLSIILRMREERLTKIRDVIESLNPKNG